MPIQLNSPGWSIQRKPLSRRSRSAASITATDFPPQFLTDESKVADEFIAQPKPAARGRAEAPAALDFSCDVAPGEAAVLSIRHPSGALTFHLPVQSTSRGARRPTEV